MKPGRFDTLTYSWIGPDSVALMHGAIVGYVWKGAFYKRLDWDIVRQSLQYLLGYAMRNGHGQTIVQRALQRSQLHWPPFEAERDAIHDALANWADDPATNVPNQVAVYTRRLQRARAILEDWSRRRGP